MSLTIDEFNAGMAAHRDAEHDHQAQMLKNAQKKAADETVEAKTKSEKDAVEKKHQELGQAGVNFLGESYGLLSSRSPQQAIQSGMRMAMSALKLTGALIADIFSAGEFLETHPEVKKPKNSKTTQGPAISPISPSSPNGVPPEGGPKGTRSHAENNSEEVSTVNISSVSPAEGKLDEKNSSNAQIDPEGTLKATCKQSFIAASSANLMPIDPKTFYDPNVGVAGVRSPNANSNYKMDIAL